MRDLKFFQSKEIKDYKEVISGLRDVFDKEHWPYILTWCGIMDNDEEDLFKYWQVWLIEIESRTIGICGLYSEKRSSNRELWIGWFGMLPQYRNNGFGTESLEYMEIQAKKIGCDTLLTYTDSKKSMNFYKKNGFVVNYRSEAAGMIFMSKKIA